MVEVHCVVVCRILTPSNQVHGWELGDKVSRTVERGENSKVDEIRFIAVAEGTDHPLIVQTQREDAKHHRNLHEARSHLYHNVMVCHVAELMVHNGHDLLIGLSVKQRVKEDDFAESPEASDEGVRV